MGVKHTVLTDGQPPNAAFTVLAQLCGPMVKEMEMGAILNTESPSSGYKSWVTKPIPG